MNKVVKFLETMKYNWDWSISGPKTFEKAMLKVAKKLKFVEVDKINILKYKDELKKVLLEFNNGKHYDDLAKRIWKDLKENVSVSDDATVIIFHPFGKTSFPDFLIFTKDKFHYVDCKIYNKNGKKKTLYLGETLEKPLGIYVTFDQDNQIVNWFYGWQLNSNLEQAYNIHTDVKSKLKKFEKELQQSNEIMAGIYGDFWPRLVRKNNKKFIPHKNRRIEEWEQEVINTIPQPVFNFIDNLKKTWWGPLQKFIGEVND
tara:strand:- start:268 stop:1041 length:774 start_codon:yes stop_codon:yes gene_type:complete